MRLDPDALAESGNVEMDSREGVQEVTGGMILEYVLACEELPPESASPFSDWLYREWESFNEEGKCTNRQVIAGALFHWCGGRTK